MFFILGAVFCGSGSDKEIQKRESMINVKWAAILSDLQDSIGEIDNMLNPAQKMEERSPHLLENEHPRKKTRSPFNSNFFKSFSSHNYNYVPFIYTYEK